METVTVPDFETIQDILYNNNEVTVNPGKIPELPPLANDKPTKISQKNLSSRAIDFMNKKKIDIEDEVNDLKI